MKIIDKCKFKIEREALRINNINNNISTKEFPNVFGLKEKNKFITANKDESILILKSPFRVGLKDVYDRFDEITNVTIEELNKINECICPVSEFQNKKTNITLSILIDDEIYSKLRLFNNNLSMLKSDFWSEVKKNFDKNINKLKEYYGELKFEIVDINQIKISNIMLNYNNKNGITIEECKFLVEKIFSFYDNEENEYKLEKRKNLNKDVVISIMNKYSDESKYTLYSINNYKKLVAESMVILKDAIARGVDYEVLNETKSIVLFENNGKKEFVIEGNKTNRDNYIFPIITDDKFVAKQVLEEAGLCVPKAVLLKKDMDEDEKKELLDEFYDKKVVVKPRNTNYGTGITVFANGATKEQLQNAINYAFEFDTDILIEQYIKGMEYRFLVIDGKCLSIVNRRPASVVGDGSSTINQLIDKKNKELWHFLTGTPVKKDQAVEEYLKTQNYNYETIIPEGKRVFLRTNSNCSTGGESVVYTDVIPNYFKRVAEKAAKAFNGKICGVDIIIDDLQKEEYSIIEINDNPGYSINEWPYEGKGEKIGIAILKLLELID